MAQTKTAKLYRMVMEKHVCPYGLKSKHLLKKQGFEVEDHHLTTREETDAFKEKHGVKTTPQTFIDGKRIGGYDDLRAHFGEEPKGEDETTYRPVIALFAMTFLMALMVCAPAVSRVPGSAAMNARNRRGTGGAGTTARSASGISCRTGRQG